MGWIVLVFAALGIWFLVSIGNIDEPGDSGQGCFLIAIILLMLLLTIPLFLYIGIHNGYDWCEPNVESEYHSTWKEAKQRRERIKNGFIDEKQRR